MAKKLKSEKIKINQVINCINEVAERLLGEKIYFGTESSLDLDCLRDAMSRFAERAQVKTSNQVDMFFNMSLDMLCIAGTDATFKKINPTFTQVLGYSPEELLSKPFLDFIHPDDLAATMREVEKLSTGIPTIHFENRYRHRNGSYRTLSWTSSPDAATGLLYAVARDITEQKNKQEERLREAEMYPGRKGGPLLD